MSNKITFFILGLLISLAAAAGHEKGSSRLDLKNYSGSNNMVFLQDNKITSVQQLVANNTPPGFFDQSYKNRLVLGIDRNVISIGSASTSLTGNKDYSAEVIVTLISNKINSLTTPPYILFTTTTLCTLKVNSRGATVNLSNVNNGVTETDMDAYNFDFGYQTLAVINSITIKDENTNTVISPAVLPENLYLELQCDAERYYTMNQASTPYSSASQFFIRYYSGVTTGNEIEVNWARIPGADEYELEWAWLDEFNFQYTTAQGTFANAAWTANPQLNFRNNSVRIRTDQNFYRVPNTFESGYVFFRVRGVTKLLAPPSLLAVTNEPLTECVSPWTWADVTNNFPAPGSFAPTGNISSIGSPVVSVPVGGGITGLGGANVPLFVNLLSLSMEQEKNWVYTSNFAEEGKKKENVGFFDGSLRQRQSVTSNNTTKTAIVTENYYDFLGRESVQSLPAPVNDGTLKFYQTTVNGKNGFNFENVGSNPRPFGKEVFAVGSGAGQCGSLNGLSGFSNLYGSGLYYSNNNPFINTTTKLETSYVPDAENFPFTQTEFVADNTSKISRQSSVGPTFRIHNQIGLGLKHDNRYMYSIPLQEELDRLFGSECGYASRYKKNVVVDANGQANITYLNENGKTVATALTGANPASLNPLKNSAGTALNASSGVMQIDLLNKANATDIDTDKDNNQLVGDALVFTQDIIVTSPQNYLFDYRLTGPNGFGICNSICLDCVYDLTFDIVDKCGNRPAGLAAPIVLKLGTVVSGVNTPAIPDSLCNDDIVSFNFQQLYAPSSNSLSVALDVGAYTVTKKLTVNNDAIEKYLKIYLNNCPMDLGDFENAEASNLNTSGCSNTCQQCVTALGTLNNYITSNQSAPNPPQSEIDRLTAEYNSLVKSCVEPCQYVSVCDANKEAMLIDMSPNGQYADYEGANNSYDPNQYNLSIFNLTNSLSKKTALNNPPSWKEPEHYLLATNKFHYFEDDNVTISYVDVIQVSPGVFQPPVANTSYLVPSYSSNQGLINFQVEPHYLSNGADFIANWKASWANSLLKYHPEYCYLEWCMTNRTVTGTNVGPVYNYNIDPNTGNPTTLDPTAFYVNSSDKYDSLLVAVDDLDYIGSGSSGTDYVLNPITYDPYWTTTGYYYVAPAATAFPNSTPSQALPRPASNLAPSGINTSPNVKQLQPSGVPADFSNTGLHYPDKYNKNANDRFANFKGTGLNLYQYSAVITSALGSQVGANAATLISGLNSSPMYVLGAPSPGNPVTYITNMANGSSTAAQKDQKRKTWEFFKTMYLAMKQELQQEAAQAYVMNSGCRGCNDCIGQPNFDFNSVPFTTYSNLQAISLFPLNNAQNITWAFVNYFNNWFFPYTAYNIKQQCGMSTASLYKSKTKRFQQNKDAKALNGDTEITDDAEANIYASTGLCPKAFYFKNFLNDMVDPTSTNNLKSGSAINLSQTAPSFNKELYDVITNNSTSSTSPPMYTNVSASGANLTGKITVSSFSDLRFTLSFVSAAPGAPVSPSPLDWANYNGTYQIVSFTSMTVTGQYAFTVKAKIQTVGAPPVQTYEVTMNGTTLVNGYTGLDLTTCGFEPPCKLNGNGKALGALFNSLILANVFGTTYGVAVGGSGNTTGSPHHGIFNNSIKPFLETGTPNSATWSWQLTTTSLPYVFVLTDGTSGANANKKIRVTITSSAPGVSTSQLNCLNSIENFKLNPDQTNYPGGFFATISTKIVPGLSAACPAASFDISGYVEIGTNLASMSPYNIGTCSFDLMTCRGQEYDMKKDMQTFSQSSSFINMLINNSYNLTNVPELTMLMRSFLTAGTNYGTPSGTPPVYPVVQNYYYWLKDVANSNANSVTGWIFESTVTPAPSVAPSNACKLTLKFANATHSSPTITNLSLLYAFALTSGPIKNGSIYTFNLTNQVGDPLICETTCMPMKTCQSCVGTTPVTLNQTVPWYYIQTFDCATYTNFTLNHTNPYAASPTTVPYTFMSPLCNTSANPPSAPGFSAQIVNNANAFTFEYLGGGTPFTHDCEATGSAFKFSSGVIGGSYKGLQVNQQPPIFVSPTSPYGISQTYCMENTTTNYQQTFNAPMAGTMQFTFGITSWANPTVPQTLTSPFIQVYIDNNPSAFLSSFWTFTTALDSRTLTSSTGITAGPHTLRLEVSNGYGQNFPWLVGWILSPIGAQIVNTSTLQLPCVNGPTWPADTLPTVNYEEPCAPYLQDNIDNAAAVKYENYIEDMKNKFISDYKKHCLGQARENILMKYNDNDYHFTLYYYDQAGNLIRTVPPEGVKLLNPTTTGNPNIFQNLKTQRSSYPSGQTIQTAHEFRTTYTYNSLNQLVQQETPDAGLTLFYYDNLGRLVLSQNAGQTVKSALQGVYYYSYTRYDELNRIVETGEIRFSSPVTSYGATLPSVLGSTSFPTNMSPLGRGEVTQTYYSPQTYFNYLGSLNFWQSYATNRVATVVTEEVYDGNDWTFDNASHFGYDAHGNVKNLMQENRALNVAPFTSHQFKRFRYNYDLLTGKVNEVIYQDGARDMLAHRYEYDAENRITNVYSSRNGYHWDQDAKYFYYLNGALARNEVGEHKIQGIDYAYTLQGWTKGVNSDALVAARDIGKDGYNVLNSANATNYVHNYFANDALGYSLNYFATNTVDDYKPVSASVYGAPASYFLGRLPALSSGSYPQVYNGNISSMGTAFLNANAVLTSIPNTGQSITKYANYSQLKLFTYDQLHRINNAAAPSNYIDGSNNWQLLSSNPTQFGETFNYDENGNIMTVTRNSSSAAIDNLQYYYYTKAGGTYLPGAGNPVGPTNRLARVTDAVGTPVGDDIGNQSSSTNYTYDANGSLTADASEQIATIEWTVQGKIKRIIRTGVSLKKNIEFKYDAQGNRISKRLYTGTTTQTDYQTTYYVRDGNGNIIATYEKDYFTSAPDISLTLKELNLYGNGRLGTIAAANLLVMTQGAGAPINNTTLLSNRILGIKNYELNNHLDNVLTVVSDRKIAVDPGNDGTADYFVADVLSTADYFVFGASMPGRAYTISNYRYGFNGMEKDDEVKGNGNSYTTLQRQYDPRLGRWISVDPEEKEYPDESPYAAMDNNPISETDPEGDCPWCIAALKGAIQEYATQVITNLANGKGLGDALTDVDGGEIVKAAVIDGLTLGVGSLVSKAKTAVKVVKAADKVVDAEKIAVKTNKVANTTGKVSKVEKNVAKAEQKLAGGCFIKGTLVLTSKGLKPIEQIAKGDSVWAYSDSLKKTAKQFILNTYTRQVKQLVTLVIGTSIIITTAEHPFYINDTWVEAQNLEVGKQVTLFNGQKVRINFKQVKDTLCKVYNFTVQHYHSYYVSNLCVLVHNTGPGCGAPTPTKASDMPVTKKGTPEWEKAKGDLKALDKGKKNVRVETAKDAKDLLTESRGNMNRYKQYSKDKGVTYKKGYETHNQQNPREINAGNDQQHIKWKDGKAGGHIYYKKPN